MTIADTVDQGRESFGRQAWGNAYDQLSAADHETPLELEDIERLAVAAYLTGRDGDSADVRARASRVPAPGRWSASRPVQLPLLGERRV